ncbi:MAG: hypothetical protein KF757_10890 [Phycisphaeraceae bacterium]|nr:hypothetical protein [Phycisphaeraceae bacterium]MCW5762195.1 hypothetical protein [Phycisphaeraceae bacterium]
MNNSPSGEILWRLSLSNAAQRELAHEPSIAEKQKWRVIRIENLLSLQADPQESCLRIHQFSIGGVEVPAGFMPDKRAIPGGGWQ